MSLTEFVQRPEVVAKIKPLRPKLPRKIAALVKAAPRTKHYMVVGSAFDYLLRFEIQRRAPHAVACPWVAEAAPDCTWQNGFFVHLTKKDKGPMTFSTEEDALAYLAKRYGGMAPLPAEAGSGPLRFADALAYSAKGYRGMVALSVQDGSSFFIRLAKDDKRVVVRSFARLFEYGKGRAAMSIINLLKDNKGVVTLPGGPGDDEGDEELAKETAGRMRHVVERAKSAFSGYLKDRSPTPVEQADFAGHAIRLAKLDGMSRALRFDPSFEEADPEDMQDLLDLLAVVPWGELVHDKVLLLNPMFGESSSLVGGADTDLIAGDTLIDFKTTKTDEMKPEHLDQLLGYFLLARNEHCTGPTFPEIKRLGIYFSRHAHLWAQDVSLWTRHPDFPELEKWFFGHAKEVYGRNQERVLTAKAKGQPG